MTFRERVRDEMKFQGLTVKELSAKTGLKIARALSVPLEYLVFGENDSDGELKKSLSKKYLLQNELISTTSKFSENQLKNFVQISKLFAESTEN